MKHETIDAALVGAMAEMPNVSKSNTANVGQYSYSYADLGMVLDAARPVLSKHGLGVVQDVQALEGRRIGVTTILVHESGGRLIFGPLPMDEGKTPQALGSAITYARRYALLAALGIATEDDDGQTARKEARHEPPPEPTFSKASTDLAARVAQAVTNPDMAKQLRKLGSENGRKPFTAEAFDADEMWAAVVAAELDAQ